SLDDVSGKSVAISEGTMMEYLVDSYFKELGIDINSVEKVNIPSLSLRYETLNSGEVDMAILPDPMGDMSVLNGCNVIVDDTKLNNNYSRSVIAFTKDYINSNKSGVEAFMKGYNAAIDRINEKNDEDLDLIYSVANVPEMMQGKWEVPHYTKNAVPTKEEVENLMSWMVEKNLLDTAYDYSDVVDAEFVSGD
ncbi:MAG: ABC transporter substrate-binding protein, partial [Parasporobacterium sp.]|nr:ABC transporter substrate-binding protein [Parasporobacterium sp.]